VGGPGDEQSGSGPVLICVSGAFNDRSRCAAVAQQLTGDFTVITYDRRGRGDSGDNSPYAVEHEIDDLNA
jgi:pimeloyl-ACP methyl ester carboxylesterase